MSTSGPDKAALDRAELALRPIFDAMRRGTKRSRLRRLVVVCENGHALVEVFPTAAGDYALWRERRRYDLDDATGEIIEHKPAIEANMADWIPPAADGSSYLGWALGSACRCTEDANIPMEYLRDLLDRGVRRAVAPQRS